MPKTPPPSALNAASLHGGHGPEPALCRSRPLTHAPPPLHLLTQNPARILNI